MSVLDWLITLVPLAAVVWFGWRSRRYITGVSDYLVAGRVGRRYVLCNASLADCIGLVTLLAYVEVHYKTGFALAFWNQLMLPISMVLALSGYCTYRFRETRCLSIGQFLELRYSRCLRIFSCFLRSIAEMLANMILPSLAARFFITYLDLPRHFMLFGVRCSTFLAIMLLTLTLAITLICMGGALSIIVSNTLQGLVFLPSILVFIVFLLIRFPWSTEIVPVMADRAAGESFLNPYDISGLRDFNLVMLITMFMGTVLHRASGFTGDGNAAISAHEQKMAGILGTWRSSFTMVFYAVVAAAVICVMLHANHAADAKAIRMGVSRKALEELVPDSQARAAVLRDLEEIPEVRHRIGVDSPLSEENTPDQPYFVAAQRHFGLDGEGSSRTQQFKTLFRQMMFPAAMRRILPVGLTGLFCLLVILFILSTDDARIFSASSTLVQDCIVPLYRAGKLTPEQHIRWIRAVSIGVGLFFLVGSWCMAQLDYIQLFTSVTYGMWLGGCGPMFIFGFYSRLGTTAGAWASLISGMVLNLLGILGQRTWADTLFPWLERHGLADGTDRLLRGLSRPFHPFLDWKIDRLKFPINSYEIYLLALLVSLLMFYIVSWLTCRQPFNLERLLHRGRYAVEGGTPPAPVSWRPRAILQRILGFTPQYTRADRAIAWGVFAYTFVWQFFLTFLAVVLWHAVRPWDIRQWGNYFFVVTLAVPAVAAGFTAVWFVVGGLRDLRHLFAALRGRVANPLDNGMVEGNTSLADQAAFAKADQEQKTGQS